MCYPSAREPVGFGERAQDNRVRHRRVNEFVSRPIAGNGMVGVFRIGSVEHKEDVRIKCVSQPRDGARGKTLPGFATKRIRTSSVSSSAMRTRLSSETGSGSGSGTGRAPATCAAIL